MSLKMLYLIKSAFVCSRLQASVKIGQENSADSCSYDPRCYRNYSEDRQTASLQILGHAAGNTFLEN